MNKFLFILAAVAVTASLAQPGVAHTEHGKTVPDPAGHAPAGVMYEHMHKAGEWMIGYRLRRSERADLFHGSDQISEAELEAAGFSNIPKKMTMQMHMLDIMYAPTDWLNLMVMPQFMSMDMSMNMLANDHHDGHESVTGLHDHGTSGVGDTVVAALLRLQDGAHSFHSGLGLSIPTGSVTETGNDGLPVHYGMQLGSGTWDLIPTLTYNGGKNALSWGAQLGGTFRMESENESGFSFGDKYYATGWSAYRLVEWANVSVRLRYSKEDSISGHYSGSHNHSSPGDLQENYGGEVWDLALGTNLVIPSGFFANHRVGFEWMERISEDNQGYQLGNEQTFILNWSKGF